MLNCDELCIIITDGIYSTFKANKMKNSKKATQMKFNPNLLANLQMYQQLMKNGRNEDEYRKYMETWLEVQNLARKHKENEFNTKINKRWSNCKKGGRTLWFLINFKGEKRLSIK